MYRKALVPLGVVIGALFAVQIFPSFEYAWMDTAQQGFRGTGMETVSNPNTVAMLEAANQPPDSFGPTEPGGDPASEIYQNVQLLGHLTEDEFNTLMLSITQWIAPEKGCEYCHNLDDLASDEIYTKNVARRMIQMTWNINANWGDHVQGTGVNCFSCHRGQGIPEYAWYSETGPAAMTGGMAADRNSQNVSTKVAVYSSLPYDALDSLLANEGAIRVQATNALPIAGQSGKTIQSAEKTYSLMMHMSDSLGQNCTFCHNTRSFGNWEESNPVRTKAWYGIRMVRDVNQNYVIPLTDSIPDDKLGPNGDIAKVNCATCHQGISKPMYGADMISDHPYLSGPAN